MEHQYSVTVDKTPCGKVCVERRGLYYHFSCRCTLPQERISRLIVRCGTVQRSLGVLVPAGEEFVLSTRLAARQLGEGELHFFVSAGQEPERTEKQNERPAVFVPIRAGEPFEYISSLKRAFLERKDGQVGIRVEKMQEC